MKPELLLRPVAAAEIEEAFQWYDEQKRGLGRQFLEAVREALSAVEAAPQQFPRVRGEIRRALLRRFPYAILYIAEEDHTVVVGCFHGKRDPRRWHPRR